MSHALTRRYHSIPEKAIRIHLPDVSQVTDYSCGASSLQSICKYFGVGPDDEWDFTRDIRYDHREGANPDRIIAAATHYGLKTKQFFEMSDDHLKQQIETNRPVMIMIQAWTEDKIHGRMHWKRSYGKDWHDGHWIVAIGFDRHGFFFEDPSLQAIRGFISYRDLDTRWRDTGKNGVHMPRYGLAVWKPRATGSMYAQRAEYIE